MGNILKVCGKDGSIILSKETDNGKEPWDMSIEWTSPDVTIPSQFISSLDDTPTSVGSTTLEVSEESTLIDDYKTDSLAQDEKHKKTVQFDENRHHRIEYLKQYINQKECQEESDLCKAINEGSVYSFKVIKRLVESGEDINFRDKKGDPILYTALFYEQYDVVALLIENGADVNLRNKKWDPIICTAVQSNIPDITELIIQSGADVDSRNNKGDTVLYTAVLSKQKEMVQLLLKYNVDVNIRNTLGTSCLEEAMTSEQMDVLEMLVEAGADIDIKDKEGNHLLHVAMMFKQLGCLHVLLNYGADVNIPDKEGNPALEMAILMKHMEAIKLLLQHGADVNMKNNKGIPVFHKAVFKCGADIMKVMINCGADVNIKDNLGNSAIYKAVERNNCEVLTLLLDCGADGNLNNMEGLTCLEHALTLKLVKPSIIKTLMTSGTVLHTDYKSLDRYMETSVKDSVNADDYVTFCDRALFMTSTQSEQHIRQWSTHDTPNKYWFNQVNIICDHVHIDCIIDARLQLAYETLQLITIGQRREEHGAFTVKDAENIEDVHPFEAEEPKAITEFELLLTTRNKLKDGINFQQTTSEGNSMMHLAVKYKHNCLLRFLLNNGGNLYKRNRKSVSPLKLAFKIDEKLLLKPMSSCILRDFAVSNVLCNAQKDILWAGWRCICKRHTMPPRELCSADLVIAIETNNLRVPPESFFKCMEVVCILNDSRNHPHVSNEIHAIGSKMNHTCSDEDFVSDIKLPHVDWNEFFKHHSNLRFACPSRIRSLNFLDNNHEHELKVEHCLRLICRGKGIIPIDEEHFPAEIHGFPTDCVEDDIVIIVKKTQKKYQLISLQRHVYPSSDLDNASLRKKADSSLIVVETDNRISQRNNESAVSTRNRKCVTVRKAVFNFPIDSVDDIELDNGCCV